LLRCLQRKNRISTRLPPAIRPTGEPVDTPSPRCRRPPTQRRSTPRSADQRRTNERFIRETKPVRDFLVRNAVRLTRQCADAEDLVQETLLKAPNSA
jgi:Sigma-70 region 2